MPAVGLRRTDASRARLAETIAWLIGVFAAQSPGYTA
jgi:hypothetical protein